MMSVAALYRRVRTLLRLAELLRVDSSKNVQILQVKPGADDVLSAVEHREPYGFTAHPKKDGADPLVIALNGNPGHSLVIMVGNRKYRLKGLLEGEVALYDDQLQQILLKRSHIEINAPLGYVINGNGTFNGDQTINGDVAITGNTAFVGSVTANSKTIDNNHTHGGVTPGSGSTGVVT